MFAQWKSGSALRIDAAIGWLLLRKASGAPTKGNTLAVAAAKLNHEISLALQLFLFRRVESTLCIGRGGNELNSLLLSAALQIIRYTQQC